MNAGGKLRVAFAGTPDFATPALAALCANPRIELTAVYTQPDRGAGRGRQIMLSPVKRLAQQHSLPVLQPANFKSSEDIAAFKALELDVLVVAAYGLILPQEILDAVSYPINIHASVLPRWRGAAPIQRAIMAGDKTSGISIIRITPKLDAGPVWHTVPCDISDSDTGGSLHDKLAELGAQAITEAINAIVSNHIIEASQEESLVTYAEKITASDRELQWHLDAATLERHIRALNPVPVATTNLGDQQCKVWRAKLDPAEASAAPGTIAYANKHGIGINTARGILQITELQPPGKKPLSAAAFVNGYGDRLTIANG